MKVWLHAVTQEHWLTIRKIDGSWYNFNSLYPAPEFLGAFYLTAFLATLREQARMPFTPCTLSRCWAMTWYCKGTYGPLSNIGLDGYKQDVMMMKPTQALPQ